VEASGALVTSIVISWVSPPILKIQYYRLGASGSPCNPSYSGDRDQEDQGSKPGPANSLRDPLQRKPNTKKGWRSGSRYRT
jgi:hypothetical protein